MTGAVVQSPVANSESRLRTRCPHCRTTARARSSKWLTPTYCEVRFECRNHACGHIWLAGLEALRTLCPSDQPDPEVHIPLAAAIRAAMTDPAAAPVTTG